MPTREFSATIVGGTWPQTDPSSCQSLAEGQHEKGVDLLGCADSVRSKASDVAAEQSGQAIDGFCGACHREAATYTSQADRYFAMARVSEEVGRLLYGLREELDQIDAKAHQAINEIKKASQFGVGLLDGLQIMAIIAAARADATVESAKTTAAIGAQGAKIGIEGPPGGANGGSTGTHELTNRGDLGAGGASGGPRYRTVPAFFGHDNLPEGGGGVKPSPSPGGHEDGGLGGANGDTDPAGDRSPTGDPGMSGPGGGSDGETARKHWPAGGGGQSALPAMPAGGSGGGSLPISPTSATSGLGGFNMPSTPGAPSGLGGGLPTQGLTSPAGMGGSGLASGAGSMSSPMSAPAATPTDFSRGLGAGLGGPAAPFAPPVPPPASTAAGSAAPAGALSAGPAPVAAAAGGPAMTSAPAAPMAGPSGPVGAGTGVPSGPVGPLPPFGSDVPRTPAAPTAAVGPASGGLGAPPVAAGGASPAAAVTPLPPGVVGSGVGASAGAASEGIRSSLPDPLLSSATQLVYQLLHDSRMYPYMDWCVGVFRTSAGIETLIVNSDGAGYIPAGVFVPRSARMLFADPGLSSTFRSRWFSWANPAETMLAYAALAAERREDIELWALAVSIDDGGSSMPVRGAIQHYEECSRATSPITENAPASALDDRHAHRLETLDRALYARLTGFGDGPLPDRSEAWRTTVAAAQLALGHVGAIPDLAVSPAIRDVLDSLSQGLPVSEGRWQEIEAAHIGALMSGAGLRPGRMFNDAAAGAHVRAYHDLVRLMEILLLWRLDTIAYPEIAYLAGQIQLTPRLAGVS